jgi:putative methyltransferase (TIGR04325 family)
MAINLKFVLRQLAPPIIIFLYRAIRRSGLLPAGLRNVGPSWPTDTTADWNDRSLFQEKITSWDAASSKLSDKGALGFSFDDHNPLSRNNVSCSNLYMSYAYSVAKAARGNNNLKVLDYGGALGQYYLLSHSLFPEISFDYHCKEMEEAVKIGCKKLPYIKWHTSDDCLSDNYDLIHIGSSLQYAEKWKEKLEAMCTAASGYIFLGRTPLTRNTQLLVQTLMFAEETYCLRK